MVILFLLVVLWTSHAVTKLLRAQHARMPSEPGTDTASENGPAWSALDDRQLTRLLTDSAPRSTTE